MNERTYKAYVQILEDELIVATGCTEPIAIAFASAKAAQVLGSEPERISISVSGNIIKNVHSVTVPNTGGQHGVKTAVAAGIAAGDAGKGLDVLSGLNDDGRACMARYLEEHEIRVEFADTSEPFYIDVRVFGDNGGSARVVMAKNHTNVVLVERDGEILQDTRTEDPSDGENALTELLNVADILEFADTVDLADVEEMLSRQADCNYAISREGLKNDWGGRVGKLYASDAYPDDLLTQAKAAAAAGSDARMGGCPMPVVIVSGSGNQGITASVPIVVYARALDIPREKMLSEIGNRMPVRVLRSRERRHRRSMRHRLSPRWAHGGNRAHDRQFARNGVRHGLRRREAFLRRQDRNGHRVGRVRVSPVQEWKRVLRGRRNRHHGRRRDHPQREPHGPRGHEGDRSRDLEHHDRLRIAD